MRKRHLGIFIFFLFVLSLGVSVHSQSSPDAGTMRALKASLGNPLSLGWTDPDPCSPWPHVQCDGNRVTRIQIGNHNLEGTLPPDLKYLSSLTVLEVMKNQLSGPIPSLAGLGSLQQLVFDNNKFSSIPPDFFTGLTSLQSISLDYNPFSSWGIPESLKEATGLQKFSANGANVLGTIPEFLGGDTFPVLMELHLSMNNLHGQIPSSFSVSSIQSLWLNDQNSDPKLNGSVAVLQNMTALTEVWIHGNSFAGPLPDVSGLSGLKVMSVRDNQLTGIVPSSLVSLPSLTVVNLTNNLLQGPIPKFDSQVRVDLTTGSNSFCLNDPVADCDSRVNILLSIAESMGYPVVFAQSWKGNDPCDSSQTWKGISCDDHGKITVVNFQNLGLSGTISPNFSMFTSLKQLLLSNNMLTGTIPSELTALPVLTKLDVSNNNIYGKVPSFKQNVDVLTSGNPDFGKNSSSSTPSSADGGGNGSSGSGSNNTGKIVGSVIGALCVVFIIGVGVCLFARRRKRSSRVQSPNIVTYPPREENKMANKISAARWSVYGGELKMTTSIQVLRNVTSNFSEENILGKGGFGTVYKGELHDGLKIAIKRMGSGLVSKQGLTEFESEVEVLTKLRHRHLVALLGYCSDENERLLVYEYMAQGTLSRHLFKWKEEGLKPLEWTRRLTIALDVARGVEYLHGLAHQCFIHRDLKPSNILLGENMQAKVADFGLVRLVPENGKHSVTTRLAGTFGYLAPEYVETGRATTKVDVYSFGVVLMELITGRKAVDATNPEDVVHLVTWFRKMLNNNDTFREAIDQTIELDEETLSAVRTVAVLADCCCARKPNKRPGLDYVVNVLSSLTILWKPTNPLLDDDIHGIDLYTTLPRKPHSTQESLSTLAEMKVPESHYSL